MRRLFLLCAAIMSGCSDYKLSSILDDETRGTSVQIDSASPVFDTGTDDDPDSWSGGPCFADG